MAEIGESHILPRPETQKETDLFNVLSLFMGEVKKVLNRGILFSDNVDCDLVEFTTSSVANSEIGVSHDLGKVPTGFITYSLDKAAVIYNGSSSNTDSEIYVKANDTSVAVKAIVF